MQHLLNDVKQILDPAEKRTIFIAMAAHMQRINDHTLKQYTYWLQRWAQAVEVIDKTQSHSLQEAITALQKAGQEVIFAALDQNQPAFAENAKEISEYLKQIMPVLTQSSQLSSTLFSSSSTSLELSTFDSFE